MPNNTASNVVAILQTATAASILQDASKQFIELGNTALPAFAESILTTGRISGSLKKALIALRSKRSFPPMFLSV